EECENCRFKSSCVDSLELNRKYVITDVKENEQNLWGGKATFF
ncbi:MAG: UPF0179 family protein, partial [Niallia sp.]